MIKEVWRKVTGYEGYEVSNHGRVRSLDRIDHGGRNWRGRILKQHLNHKGYCCVSLYKKGHPKKFTVHKLVALAFIPNEKLRKEINHKDGDKTNNHVNNLEWSTRLDNTRHSYEMGLNKCFGENHHNAKLTEQDVIEIYERVHEGEKGTDLAKEFGVYKTTISNIKLEKRWTHVTQKFTRRA